MTPRQSSPVGDAFAWAGRIMAVGLIMVLPGVGGSWLDDRLDTTWCEPAGFVIGFTAGLTSLIRMATFRGRQPPPDSTTP
ncbi:MAG: AtpZ/AtpI family protein [Planctomycetia bacterium]|nr:AtpZ/AtpI family protein [Planctomycetia bacterium]